MLCSSVVVGALLCSVHKLKQEVKNKMGGSVLETVWTPSEMSLGKNVSCWVTDLKPVQSLFQTLPQNNNDLMTLTATVGRFFCMFSP